MSLILRALSPWLRTAVAEQWIVQPNPQNTPSGGHRVLVVDDDIDTAQSLFLLLLDMGHDAAYATDGKAALQMARKLQPEFVLLDIGLPDLDGGEVATRLGEPPVARTP